jgi:hypothetical protein
VSTNYRRRFAFAQLAYGAALMVVLFSCRSLDLSASKTWSTYDNRRYGFEFLYPSNWVASPMPDNLDGRAFSDPHNPTAEIRGWAGSQLPEISPELQVLSLGWEEALINQDQVTEKQGQQKTFNSLEGSTENFSEHQRDRAQQQNFITAQGRTGYLNVKVGLDTSAMTLMLKQGRVQYNWRGQCSSQQFDDYYRLFTYIARNYRLPPQKAIETDNLQSLSGLFLRKISRITIVLKNSFVIAA